MVILRGAEGYPYPTIDHRNRRPGYWSARGPCRRQGAEMVRPRAFCREVSMAKLYEIWEDEMTTVGWIVRIFKTTWFLEWNRGRLHLLRKPSSDSIEEMLKRLKP
jgi:hypothetical protein